MSTQNFKSFFNEFFVRNQNKDSTVLNYENDIQKPDTKKVS